MCGIIGYSGNMLAKKILLNALSTLEYRGYDSAGIALFNDDKIDIIKTAGKVEKLKTLAKEDGFDANCGMGHTRWATHGGVTNENAHPHMSNKVCLVHNGIIENYQDLIKKFNITNDMRKSSTDSEIAAIILDKFYEENNDPNIAIEKLINEIKGTYAFLILFSDRPNEIYAITKVSPLVCATTSIGSLIASDLTAIIEYTKNYFVVPEGNIIKLTNYDIKSFDLSTHKYVELKSHNINFNLEATIKGAYPHFMLKEIYEQPECILNSLSFFINDGLPDFSKIGLSDDKLKEFENIQILACGTSRHAGLVASTIFTPIVKIPIQTFVASEYRYSNPYIKDKTLSIYISQSGETVDTFHCLELNKKLNDENLALVNIKNSIIARNSKYVLYTNAGPEIAVASTKAYTVQIAMLYLLFFKLAYVKKEISLNELKDYTTKLLDIPNVLKETLSNTEEIEKVARFLKFKTDCFYIGRQQDYISSLEGALKLKEISYIHTDAYAAGELKHGTIALISDGVPVIAIDTNKNTHEKLISNVEEVRARNANIILIINENFKFDEDIADLVIKVKDIDDKFSIFPVSIITQLIAYYTSVAKGLDVDKPRNLAKSVTVE